jgi:hypothetical protein
VDKILYNNRFIAIALPEPVLKYFSKEIALFFESTAM